MLRFAAMLEVRLRGHQLLNAVLSIHLNRNGISGYSDEHTHANRLVFDQMKSMNGETPIQITDDFGALCVACPYNPDCYVANEQDLKALAILQEVLNISKGEWTIRALYNKISDEQYYAIRDKFYPSNT